MQSILKKKEYATFMILRSDEVACFCFPPRKEATDRHRRKKNGMGKKLFTIQIHSLPVF